MLLAGDYRVGTAGDYRVGLNETAIRNGTSGAQTLNVGGNMAVTGGGFGCAQHQRGRTSRLRSCRLHC